MTNRHVRDIIRDESPDNHWGFLPVFNKVVLDLGCGLNSEFTPTPWYFLQDKKAKKVYGVDADPNSYNWFKQNYNVQNFIPFMDYVDRFEKFEWYFENSKPEIVKMDVEGAEIVLHAINPKCLSTVTDIAIEYHSYAALVSCETLLEKLGMIISYYKFENIDLEFQGVIYGRLPKDPEEQKYNEMNKWKKIELNKINKDGKEETL
jgi:hypothetical protein